MADPARGVVSSSPALPAHQEELPQADTYRSVSWGAIAVLVGALFTPLAFLIPILWIIPLGVIVAALLVLRHLQVNADRLSGGRLVWIGLALAVLMLGWAPARYATRLGNMLGEARQVADAWSDLVNQHDLQQAHQWHLVSAERAPPGVTLEAFYQESADRQKSLQQFFDREDIAKWLKVDAAHTQYVRFCRQLNFSDAEEFVLEYQLTGKQGATSVDRPVYLVVVRRKVGDAKYEWVIANVLDHDPVPLDDN